MYGTVMHSNQEHHMLSVVCSPAAASSCNSLNVIDWNMVGWWGEVFGGADSTELGTECLWRTK